MIEDFPGNSRRPVPTDKTEPCVEEKKLDKVVTGKVVRRKKPLGRRLMDTFFSGEGVFGYLVKEVLVPALQATATDMVTQGIEKAVYGEVRSPNRTVRGGTTLPRTHISYDRPSSAIRPSQVSSPLRRSVVQPSAVEVGDIILATKIEAQVVVDKLYETVEEYGAATVGNLNDLIGQTSVHTDYRWGWTDLTQMMVKRVREGYLLVLPEPEDLR